MTVHRKMTKSATEHYRTLKAILLQFSEPIMQMSDRIAAIQDNFDSEFCLLLVPKSMTLNPCQGKSV